MFNSLTDIPGIRVGHYTDREHVTGCTVVLVPPEGAVGGVDVRGPAPGTVGTDLLAPGHLVERVHAVVLSGGSAFGLESAFGVMRYLEERGVGFPVGRARVPIVPAAILFDLAIGDPHVRPDIAAGYAACEAATDGAVEEGSVGAGTGATVGKLFGTEFSTQGGIGTASQIIADGITVAALVAANAVGDVVDPRTGAILAGARNPDGGWLDSASAIKGDLSRFPPGIASTTIGVVATDAPLTKEQANIVAMMAQTGIAWATRPAHMMLDGDTIFVLAVGRSATGQVRSLTAIGHAAAELVAEAIVRGVKAAMSLGGVPALKDLTADSG